MEKIHASGEDYLEAVLMLQKKTGIVRSVDLARHMGFSKPGISHAVGVLRDGGFLDVDGDGYLHLTEAGREVAMRIYERHCVLTSGLISLGVSPEQAEPDAPFTIRCVREAGYCFEIDNKTEILENSTLKD